jgi:hypothetical protein
MKSDKSISQSEFSVNLEKKIGLPGSGKTILNREDLREERKQQYRKIWKGMKPSQADVIDKIIHKGEYRYEQKLVQNI